MDFDGDVDFEEIFADCDDFGSSSISSGDGKQEAPVKKVRKSQKRKPFKIPRICMNDVRRHYGTMLARAFNSGESDFGCQFVHSFSRRTAQMQLHGYRSDFLKGITFNSLNPTLRSLSFGMETTFAEWMLQATFMMKGLFPDLICRLRNEQIFRRLGDARCTILIDLELHMSWIFEDDFVSLVNYLIQKQRLDASRSSEHTTFRENSTRTPKLLKAPSPLTHVMRLALHVDEWKCVESVEKLLELPPPYVMPLLDQARVSSGR